MNTHSFESTYHSGSNIRGRIPSTSESVPIRRFMEENPGALHNGLSNRVFINFIGQIHKKEEHDEH